LYNKITNKKRERRTVAMDIKRRQYSKEQKEKIVKKILSGTSVLELDKENKISHGLINRRR
jgi:transposase-like protein